MTNFYEIGDRIYHRNQIANGIITDFRSHTQHKDWIGVKFMWAKMSPSYHNIILPRRENGDKVELWTRPSELVLTPKPKQTKNIKMFGRVGFKKRLRAVCEIKRQYKDRFKYTDIVLGYGRTKSWVPYDLPMINRNVNCNKYEQSVMLGHMAPEVLHLSQYGHSTSPEDWILKPYYSVGGDGIQSYLEQTPYHKPRYLQRKINKVREFRAHFYSWPEDFNNQVPLIQEKIIYDKTQLCWNKNKGGTFVYKYQPHLGTDELDTELRKDIQKVAIRACNAIDYDMGGVDIGLDDEGRLWVFEVNSMVGMREKTLATFKQIIWMLGE
jgi:hypothetical protein